MDTEESKSGKFAISVSPFAASQIRDLANSIGVQPGRILGQQIETWIASPSFGAWLRRATDWRAGHPQSGEIEESGEES